MNWRPGGRKFKEKLHRFPLDEGGRGLRAESLKKSFFAFRSMAVAGGRKFRDELQRFSLVAAGREVYEMSFCAFRLMAVAGGRKFRDELERLAFDGGGGKLKVLRKASALSVR